MARQINYEKLEAIKRSTMELISQQGYQKATISAVAKNAGVSAGYLYTHFESKDALIDTLIHDVYMEVYSMLVAIGKESGDMGSKLKRFINSLLDIPHEDPIKAKFLVSLAHDERFLKEFLGSDSHGIFDIAERVMIAGKKEGIFRDSLIVEELLLTTLNLPISSIYYGFILGNDYSEQPDMHSRIADLCLNALK